MRAALVLLAALALAACSSLFYWPERAIVRDPSVLNLAFDDVEFPSADGTMLRGWYLRAAGTPRGSVLFCHGNAENISTHIGFVGWLPPAGYNVLIWDYRGFGASDGEADLGPMHEDAQAALAWLANHSSFDRDHLIVYGQSLGASIAIHTVVHSPLREHVRAVISESAFSSYRGIAREKLADLWLTWPLQWPLSFLFVNRFSADKIVAQLSPIPLLIVHGASDPVVPVEHAQKLFDAARDPRELWRVPGANHVSSLQSREMRRRVLDWLATRSSPAPRTSASRHTGRRPSPDPASA